MTISAVKSRLAEIALTAAGVVRTYANAPASISPSDAPALVVFSSAASWSAESESLGVDERAYLLRLYAAPIVTGYDYEAEMRVETLIENLRNAMLAHPHLGNGTAGSALPNVRGAEYGGDTGVIVLQYAGAQYIGAELRVTVSEYVQPQIAAYE